MNTDLATLTVAQYCQFLQNKDYDIDRRYQRSPKVWPPAARSALIETILLDFPIPKLAVQQITDLQARRTRHFVVDGQQRSMAILDFYNDKFALSRTIELDEARGKRYTQLPVELQVQFVNYALTFDVFVGVTDDQVREVFRRMNSFTIPLNAEEQRYAVYQGPFKWFVQRQAKNYGRALIIWGVLTDRAINRMADTKWLTEVFHAWTYGITTTSKSSLDSIYRDFDINFPFSEEYEKRLTGFLQWFAQLPDLWKTSLVKPFSFYSLALAHSHISSGGIGELNRHYQLEPGTALATNAEASVALTALAEIMDLSDEPTDNTEARTFWRACNSQTNVGRTREARFVTYCKAIVSSGATDQ